MANYSQRDHYGLSVVARVCCHSTWVVGGGRCLTFLASFPNGLVVAYIYDLSYYFQYQFMLLYRVFSEFVDYSC